MNAGSLAVSLTCSGRTASGYGVTWEPPCHFPVVLPCLLLGVLGARGRVLRKGLMPGGETVGHLAVTHPC